MFMGLCICITLVVIQYCRHQTVFQLDYSGRLAVYDQIPGFTICPQAQDAQRLFRQAVARYGITAEGPWPPWLMKEVMDEFRRRALELSPNISFTVMTHRLPMGELKWDTSSSAVSPIYGMLHNFSVTFRMQPPHLAKAYRLTVMEQVPNMRSFICTTFEMRARIPTRSWSFLEIELNQTTPITEAKSTPSFTIITHERGELPFSAYDRHIHTVLPPGTAVSLYFSKSVTARLNTARNPCHEALDAKFLAGEYAGSEDRTPIPDDTEYDSLQGEAEEDWYVDLLDQLRLDIRTGSNGSKTTARLVAESDLLKQRRMAGEYNIISEPKPSPGKTVSLFGTEFLYSREACGWAECCRKVKFACNCTCKIDVLANSIQECKAEPNCERSQCSDQQISYKVCPLPCVMTKFIKHSAMVTSGSETNLPMEVSQLKLIRSEAVQVATEEEIFSLAKLFSEVGGLCSLFIGFSCIFIFELFEAAILVQSDVKQHSKDNSKVSPAIYTLANLRNEEMTTSETCALKERSTLQEDGRNISTVKFKGTVTAENCIDQFQDENHKYPRMDKAVKRRSTFPLPSHRLCQACTNAPKVETVSSLITPQKEQGLNALNSPLEDLPAHDGEIHILPLRFISNWTMGLPQIPDTSSSEPTSGWPLTSEGEAANSDDSVSRGFFNTYCGTSESRCAANTVVQIISILACTPAAIHQLLGTNALTWDSV
ncbi:unnamed protein product [Calicophoron daubneyi]|uniref:Uncharacterized protein n=1 Tax=Calicophoron daubneyi TaxID=300641 RepID=A0AAV2TV64_CALDB